MISKIKKIILYLEKKIIIRAKLLRLRIANPFTKGIKKSSLIKHEQTCVILGNGPSLNKDLDKIVENKEGVDFFCVNHAAEASFFSELRPLHYALIDQYFWVDDAHETLKEKRRKLFKALNKKTNWMMHLYLPKSRNIEYIKKEIINKNIKFIVYDTLPIKDFSYEKQFKYILKGVYGPPQVNVLIYAVYLSLLIRYKDIYIYGADLSYTSDIKVDQDTNDLYMSFRHFYNEGEPEYLMQNPQRKKPFTMCHFLKITYMTFFSHELLMSMSKYLGVNIINKSSYSLIDAYPRNKK